MLLGACILTRVCLIVCLVQFPALFASVASPPLPVPPSAPLPTGFSSFSSAPDLSRSSAPIDLTVDDSHPDPDRKQSKKEKKKKKRHRSDRSEELKAKKHKHRSKEEKKSKRTKETKPSSKRRSRSPSSLSSSDSDVAILRPRVTPSAVAVDRMELVDSDSDSDVAIDLAASLRAASEAAKLADAARDREKILAIEARLADPRKRASILLPPALYDLAKHEKDRNADSAFMFDRNGDLNNLLFHSPYRYHIPVYHRSSSGVILGAAGLSRGVVSRLLSPGLGPGEVVRVPIRRDTSRRHERYFANKFTATEKDRHVKRVRPTRRQMPTTKTSPSIAVDEFKAEPEFLPLQLASQPEAPSSSPLASPSPSDGLSFEESCSNLTRSYSVALRARPQDVALWLAYIAAQSLLLTPTHTVTHGRQLWEKQALILIGALDANPGCRPLQEALFRRARHIWPRRQIDQLARQILATHPDDIDMWLMYIDWSCSDTIDTDGGVDGVVEFRAAGVLPVFERALQSLVDLRHKLSQQAQSGEANAGLLLTRTRELDNRLANVNDGLMRIWRRLLRYLLDIGQNERALALWQCQIEWNCFRMDANGVTPFVAGVSDPLSLFSHFFDCDVPRFGEVGSVGFINWIEKVIHGRPTLVRPDQEAQPVWPITDTMPIDTWIQLEQRLTEQQWMPEHFPQSREPFEDELSSLDRIVLIEDIQFGLFDLTSIERDSSSFVFDASVSDSRLRAVHQLFLSGLHDLFRLPASWLLLPGGTFLNAIEIMQNGATDIASDSTDVSAFAFDSSDFELMPCLSGFQDPMLGPLVYPSRVASIDLTRPTPAAGGPIEIERINETRGSIEERGRYLWRDQSKVAFIRRAMEQMIQLYPKSHILKIASLCFEYGLSSCERSTSHDSFSSSSSSDPFTQCRSCAKSFLSSDPSNLILLHAYGVLEFQFGFEQSADRVFTKTIEAIQNNTNNNDGEKEIRPLLFWSYAQTHIVRAYQAERDSDESNLHIREALHILLAASEGNTYTPFDPNVPLRPVRILKARKMLIELIATDSSSSWTPFDTSSTGLTVSSRAILTTIQMWIEYLVHGLEAVRTLWSQLQQRVTKHTPTTHIDVEPGLTCGSLQHSWLCTQYLRLLSAHRALHAYSPRLLREDALGVLSVFPHHGLAFELVKQSYMGLPSLELRRFFDRALDGRMSIDDAHHASTVSPWACFDVSTSDGIESFVQHVTRSTRVGRAFSSTRILIHAIRAELDDDIASGGGGSGHRINTLFERALQPSVDASDSASSQAQLMLYRLYLRYSVCKGQLVHASKLLYRAVQAMPFSKSLWLDALDWLQRAQAQAQSHIQPSSGALATPNKEDAAIGLLSSAAIVELYHSQLSRGLRHRVVLAPDRDDAQVTERPWHRYAREQRHREEEQRRRERQQRRRERDRDRDRDRTRERERRHRHRRRRRSRSRSRPWSRSRSSSRSSHSSPVTPSDSDSSGRRHRHRRSRASRSRSVSRGRYSRSRSTSRSSASSASSASRARSVSSSLERFRQRYRAPLPTPPAP